MPLGVIIGMPGAGKTRVGREVANLMHIPFIDTDAEIEQEIGMSVAKYFQSHSQEEFRVIEAKIVRNAIEGSTACSGIVSLGGGAPTDESTQEVLKKYRANGGRIVYLQANPNEAIERVGRNNNRPIFSGSDCATRWLELYEKRNPIFRSLANIYMLTNGATAKSAAEKLKNMLNQRMIHVHGTEIEEYDVRIGEGAMELLPQMLGDLVNRVALIHTQPVQRHSDKARAILRRAGYDVYEMLVPDAEAGKTVRVADSLWSKLGDLGFTRSDAIVGLGGGAVTDLAGFVASTWMRGIRYVNCPTSLLAMVDASTGGKTGVNTSAGKNLVGSFYTPAGVLADTFTFSTLPKDIFIEGLGEVVKSGFIRDLNILQILSDEHNNKLIKSFDRNVFDKASSLKNVELNNLITDLIERTVRVKVYHVSKDLKEQGLREFLNYGHTLGHAIEQIEHFRWRHGNAVSVGMVFAAQLAKNLGYLTCEDVKYHKDLLSSLGLPICWTSSTDSESMFNNVLDLMHKDKKARGNMLRFVILDGIANPIHLENPPIEAVRDAFNSVYKQK